jgi:two-component system response regulator HydG
VTDRPTVLVVDDRPNMLSLLRKVLSHDANIVTASSGGEALALLQREPVSVVLCDLRMPDMDGIDVLRECKRLLPHAEFVLMTAYATVDTAVEAMRLGAYDYLTKPFEPSDARVVVLKALARSSAAQSAAGDGSTEVLPGLLARSHPMRDLAELVRRIAASAATVLVLGETGTGKERVARAVHALSGRSERRFVALNCAAIPGELLESELFGYVKGSFTGAAKDRAGLFEEADGGTLFLDEIGDMRLSLQAKLTRVLEERAVRRVGDSRERPVDVRVIAATHRGLERMVESGAFREDLWYRLNVAAIRVPPLRDRPDDIDLLALHFLRDVRVESGLTVSELSPAALETLRAYHWPGNVRQLRSAIERAAIVAPGERIEVGDLPPDVLGVPSQDDPVDLTHMDWSRALEESKNRFARQYLRSLLRKHAGSVTDAAAAAGVERESFYRLMRRHDVNPDEFRVG